MDRLFEKKPLWTYDQIIIAENTAKKLQNELLQLETNREKVFWIMAVFDNDKFNLNVRWWKKNRACPAPDGIPTEYEGYTIETSELI